MVDRRFGAGAGLLAGLFLAVTPDRGRGGPLGNTDTGLVLVLLLAAWALTRAAEQRQPAAAAARDGLIGLGFNVKMLAAFVVLPGLRARLLAGRRPSVAPPPRGRALGGLLLAAVSLPWVVAYDLTPPARRPFAGSSPHNP